MDMRSKAYPALPEGRGLRLVLPRVGDLRFRPQVPAVFAQKLYIHADPRRRFWYARFQLKRKFIIMSTQGDLYAKSSISTFTMADLPKGNVLNMPRVVRGDLVKVLDLVQCFRSEGQRWELVFTRWRNGMETWLPLEVVQLFASNLLQEFYVNSINSWAFHSRVQSGNLSAFRTEVEIWLFHPELQDFYKKLRQKRSGDNRQLQDQVSVKPEAGVSANTSHTLPQSAAQAAQRTSPSVVANRDPSEAVIQEFEQRRLALERQEQLDRTRRDRLVQLQHQQHAEQHAEDQRRLDREREERLYRDQASQERERRTQHERQRQKAHEELQRRQKEYQQRLRAQQEREKLAELQQQEQKRLQRAKEQEQLRQRLHQATSRQEQRAQKQTPTSRNPQQTSTRTQLRHKERQQSSGSCPKPLQQKERTSSSIWTNGGDDEYIPPEGSESEDSDVSVDSESSVDSLGTRKRRRKRLLYSQVEVDDEDDDDLPDLSQPLPSSRRRKVAVDSSEDEAPVRKATRTSKKRKRHQPSPPKETGGASGNVQVDLTQLSDGDEEVEDNALEMPTSMPGITIDHAGEEDGKGDGNDSKVCAELVDADADADDHMDFEPSMIIGEIRLVKETGQTALHIAAQENHPLCVRALLLEGFNVVAKDSGGWIPVLYAVDATCIQEFMHHKLTKQLSRLHRMEGKYQQRGLVRRWQRCVARDPTCFDILNDWCQSDTERIERMEGLLLSNPFLLRLDNKIEYVWAYIIPSIKKIHGQISIGVDNGKPSSEQHSGMQTKKLAFVFSRASGCFWKQFVGMGKMLEPEDFRFPIVFSIERAGANSQGVDNRESNLKLVLIRLAAGLFKEVPGLLVRGSSSDLESNPLSSEKEKVSTQLLGYFLLGELVAHFVLYNVPLSGILDFAPTFLRCIGCKGKYKFADDEPWETAGRSFAAGFEAVLPATLELFHGDALRVLFNGPETRLNALQIDWSTAVDWKICGPEAMGGNDIESAKVWLPRLMNELVEEEQQLLLLFMTGTYQLVNERFFRSEGEFDRITIASYPETDNVLDHDMLYPTMEHKPDVLRLPSYSNYGAFKRAMLTVIRHVDQAFLPE
ncbi:uncharacterized protein KRP23_3922 [Phytophthora ramorum]|uniref:uncharacterized protein n=1 Tax=Phytophthora ramorum TaxID=164328 RepID=UPI00309BC192|nr:hypothetical protein KRP23_3922 [Phytophthora ramorum]